jgi:hypothetical protein
MSPSFSLKYANFSSWTYDLPKYMLSAHLWRYIGEPLISSGLHYKEYNVGSQCTSFFHGTLVFYKGFI